jgi:hypothetical protein
MAKGKPGGMKRMTKYVVTEFELKQGDIVGLRVCRKLFGSKADARKAVAVMADKVERTWRQQNSMLVDDNQGSALERTLEQGVDCVGEMWDKQFTDDDDAVYFLISTVTVEG